MLISKDDFRINAKLGKTTVAIFLVFGFILGPFIFIQVWLQGPHKNNRFNREEIMFCGALVTCMSLIMHACILAAYLFMTGAFTL